ncbi:MAG: GNAT family N-acetyltransferase [Pseudomonadota bacterium]
MGTVKEDADLLGAIGGENLKIFGHDNSVSHIRFDGYEDWDSYYKSVHSSRFRRSRSRRYRRLAEKGEVSIEEVKTEAEMQYAFDWLCKYKSDWGARHGKMVRYAVSEKFRDLSVALYSPRFAQQFLFVRLLKINGQTIAVSYNAVCGQLMQLIFATYDYDWKQYGPGNILMDADFQWAFENGIRELDFGPGTDNYKKEWDAQSITAKLYFIPQSNIGRCLLVCRSLLVFLRTVFYRLPMSIRSAVAKLFLGQKPTSSSSSRLRQRAPQSRETRSQEAGSQEAGRQEAGNGHRENRSVVL